MGGASAPRGGNKRESVPDTPATSVGEDQVEQRSATNADDAVTRKVWVEARLARWVSAQGFGFVQAAGVEAFLHHSTLPGQMESLSTSKLEVLLERDVLRGAGKFRVTRARLARPPGLLEPSNNLSAENPAIPGRGEVYDRTAHYPRSALVRRSSRKDETRRRCVPLFAPSR